jgi:hypothetical protein
MKVYAMGVRTKATLASWLALLAAVGGAGTSQAAHYQVGQVVTNFVLYARPSWTASGGFASDAPMRLRDFAGKIIFVEFFDPT